MDIVVSSSEIETVEICGIRVHRVNRSQALKRMEAFLQEGGPHLVVTADSSGVVIAQSDPEFRDIVNSADLVTPDSIGIVWAAKLFGRPIPERVAGVDLVLYLCEMAARRGYRVYFLGSAPGVAEEAARRLQDCFPGLAVAGTHHGYFSAGEEPQVVEMIQQTRPDILFVALGIPKQEKWIARYQPVLKIPVAMGVGGSLDVHSGRVTRAPRWVQKLCLEWAYRLLKNPRKIGKAMTLPQFALMVLRERRRF